MRELKGYLPVLLFFCVIISGCGYTTRANLPAKIRTLYVKPFINKIDTTSEVTEGTRYRAFIPALNVKVTDAVIDRYHFDGNLKIVKEEDADVKLTGELTGFSRQPLRYTENQDVEEYRLLIEAKITLRNLKDNTVIWEETIANRGHDTYFAAGPHAQSEESALVEAIADLAKNIVDRTVEGW
ncbi:MAG: hypothetical protein HY350_03045 [Candidatus Omnitrophica bacterium]|nr:hypothetical protein [Candidatus Omnitrophota bacterium]